MTLQRHNPEGVAAATGAYSLAVSVPGGWEQLWVAGQVGRRPDGSLAESPFQQTLDAFGNLEAILSSCGFSPGQIFHVRPHLVGREVLPEFVRARAEVYGRWFGDAGPPTSTLSFVVGLADPRAVVEIEAVAARLVPAPR